MGVPRRDARSPQNTHEETLDLIDTHALMDRGIGLIDAMLLGSALITPDCLLWTANRRLAEAAQDCGVAYHSPDISAAY